MKAQESADDEDEDTEDPKEVQKNTELNKHIPDEDEDDD